MKSKIFQIAVIFYCLFFPSSYLFGQLRLNFAADTNLYMYKQRADIYFDSLRNTMSEEEFNEEGSEWSEYQKFLGFWQPRLFPHGSFTRYYQALNSFYQNSPPLPPNFLSDNIIAGVNTKIILTGSGPSDKVLEITQESLYPPAASLPAGMRPKKLPLKICS